MSETDDINALAPHPRVADGASVMYRAGQIRALFVALAAKNAEIERLRGALKGARDDMAAWGAYATEYFQEKHDLPGDLAKIDAALQPQEGEK